MLIDTHCHIHSDMFKGDEGAVFKAAQAAGVAKMVMVGTGVDDSRQAAQFAREHTGAYAALAVHPHDAEAEQAQVHELGDMLAASTSKIVAIGETGLDYFYDNSPRDVQQKVLRAHLDLAVQYNLPCMFHVRGSKGDPNDAFVDFFKIYDTYDIKQSIVHSFSAGQSQLDEVLSRPLVVGVNGIATFTRDPAQQAMYKNIPLERMVLETDAPLLTPTPKRGKINIPEYIKYTAAHIAEIQQVSLEKVAAMTTYNAETLLDI